MVMNIDKDKMGQLVNKQLNNFFLSVDSALLENCIDEALMRSEKSFAASANPYYSLSDEIYFNTNNTGQYTIFLYYLSNTIYRKYGVIELADEVYYLNKIMNGVDWYFQVELPERFSIVHPVGSVLGRARFSDKLVIYQGVTVGGNLDLQYPDLGENVALFSNASILGKTKIGNNVIVSSGTQIMNEEIPDNCLVFTEDNKIKIVRKDASYIEEKLKLFWKKI